MFIILCRKQIIIRLTRQSINKIKRCKWKQKYDIIAQYASQDTASNAKFCVDYFNDFSRRKQALITHSRATGINPQQMREFRNSIESANGDDENQKKEYLEGLNNG